MSSRPFILVLALLFSSLHAQTTISGDLTARVDGHISSMPTEASSNKYQPPTAPQLSQWGTAISHLLRGNLSDSHAVSQTLGYRVVRFIDTTAVPHETHYLLERESGSTNYWGMFVFNPNSQRPVVSIQSPHPLNDVNTGRQGFFIYKKLGARAFFVSGAHRCNSPIASGCSGTTSVCSGSTEQQYRISDQAHVVDGTFQKTTEVMNSEISGLVVIQMHGFGKTDGDPDIIMSNGTTRAPSAGNVDHLLVLRQNLLLIDPTLTFKIPHIDIGWTRLAGTTNTQGRLINGSPSPCTISPSSTNGRFLHIEQAMTKLRDTPQNWDKLATALAMTFQSVTSVSRDNNAVETPDEFHLHQNYPNPFNPVTIIGYNLPKRTHVLLEVHDILGRKISTLVNGEQEGGRHQIRFSGEYLPGGIYYYSISAASSRISKSMILMK